MLRSYFLKSKYRKFRIIVKLKRIALTIATLFLETFLNEFYSIIWQLYYKVVVE